MRHAIRAAGARLFFLPKYSPDLNPIEHLFAQIKHRLCKAAARTADGLCDALSQILNAVNPQHCGSLIPSLVPTSALADSSTASHFKRDGRKHGSDLLIGRNFSDNPLA